MNKYTIKTSKMNRFWGNFLFISYKIMRFSFRMLLRLSKMLYHLSNNIKKKSEAALDKSKGITFSIISATLLDSRIIRFRIQALNGKKYHLYYIGQYKDKYKEDGKDVAVEDEHYFLAATLYDEWKLIN